VSTHDEAVIAAEEANGPYSLKSTVPGAPVNPSTGALSLIGPLCTSVTDAAGVGGMLQVLKLIGPAKSCRVEKIELPDERVCGNSVLMQPVKPSACRFTPPSKNSVGETTFGLGVWGISSRQTQPPQAIEVLPLL